MLCTFPSGSIPVRPAPTVASIDIRSCNVDLDTGLLTVVYDDGQGAPIVAQFTLDPTRLTNIQTFIKNKLGTKLGTTVL